MSPITSLHRRTKWEPVKEARLLAFEADAAAELAYYMDRAAISTSSLRLTPQKRWNGNVQLTRPLMSYHDSWTALLKAVAECVQLSKEADLRLPSRVKLWRILLTLKMKTGPRHTKLLKTAIIGDSYVADVRRWRHKATLTRFRLLDF